jgi:GntR family transcriptional regulator
MAMTRFEAPPLDRTKPLALYYQIAEILRHQIEGGAWRPGDAIPTEEELQRLFAVSRATVRQAVRRLVGEGLLRLERPRGTFVTRPKLQERLPALISFSDEVREQGLTPSTRVLLVAWEAAPPPLAQRLGIAEGSPVVRLERLGLANDEPIALMSCALVGSAGLTPEDDFSGSLYALLQRRGIRLSEADQIIEATRATAEQAHLLDCKAGSALLKIDRVTVDVAGRGVEHVIGYYRADRYRYRLKLGAQALGGGHIRATEAER